MKRNFLIALLLIAAYSCKKDNGTPDPTPVEPVEKNDIQHKWFLVNIIVYTNPEFTGPSFFGYAGNGAEYYDFRADGKVYAYAANTFDTAVYKVNTDTVLIYEIKNNIPAIKPDTARIKKLTTDSLIFAVRNPANDWGKFTFRR